MRILVAEDDAAIVGFSSVLLTRPGGLDDRDRLVRYLEMILTAGPDAAHLVRQIKDFYRPRDAADPFGPVDVNEVVGTVRQGGVAPPLVVMLSGFAESLAGADLRPPGVDRVLSKPITLASLREALRAVDA